MDVVLHVEGGDAVLEVGLHPVLHAGVGVDHEPVAGLGAQRLAELLERVRGGASMSTSSASSASAAASWTSAATSSATSASADSTVSSATSDSAVRRRGRRRCRPGWPARRPRRRGLDGLARGRVSGRARRSLVRRGVGVRLGVVRLRHGYPFTFTVEELQVAPVGRGRTRPAGQPKTAKTGFPKPRSSRDTIVMTTDEDQHHDEVRDKLLLGRPDDLAELGHDLPVEGGGAGAPVARLATARRRHRTAVRHCSALSRLPPDHVGSSPTPLLAGHEGLEPPTFGFGDRCSAS